jgi:hypothetical protein
MEGSRWAQGHFLGRPVPSAMPQFLEAVGQEAGLSNEAHSHRRDDLARLFTLGFSTALGAGYGALTGHHLLRPSPVRGALFGGALYLIDTSIAGLLGAGTAIWQEPADITARPLALHLLYGAVLGWIATL